jgi:hypothetical protein
VAVLSVDLAFRRWSNLGVVVLDRARYRKQPCALPTLPGTVRPEFLKYPSSLSRRFAPSITCEILPFSAPGLDPELDRGPIDPNVLAGRLNHLCNIRGIRILMLDGPQAWKSSYNGLQFARVGERQINTLAKTGLPGVVKPRTCRPYAEFCLYVYEALCRRGWRRLDTRCHSASPQDRVLVESHPSGAWKSLGLKTLPSRRRAKISDLAQAYAALRAIVPFTTNRPPNHDQLQAIVAGLPGLALEAHDTAALRIVGAAPRREDGQWREGFILLPVPPLSPLGLRWIN